MKVVTMKKTGVTNPARAGFVPFTSASSDLGDYLRKINSIKSLEGAPFAYGSMNFEETTDGVDFIGDEYTNFSLAKYKLVHYLYENLIYVGDVEGIEEIDRRLYLKLVSNGIKQIALIEVEGVETPLGILGVTWSKHDVMSEHKDAIKRDLRSYSVKIAYINKNSNEKK